MALNPEIFGYIGGGLTTFCLVPQVIKLIKTRNTSGISLTMYVLFTIGVSSWTVFGVMLQSLPMMLANGSTLVLCFIILWVLISERRNQR